MKIGKILNLNNTEKNKNCSRISKRVRWNLFEFQRDKLMWIWHKPASKSTIGMAPSLSKFSAF